MKHLKKISILFSLMFMLLVAPSLLGQGDAKADICQGTAMPCASRASHDDCVGVGASNDNGNGCKWNTAVSPNVCAASGTFQACGAIMTKTPCVGGCVWVVSGTSDNNAFVSTLCRALQIVTGKGGKAFAAFAIISVGIGFFTGKVSWGLMIGVTAGIAAMFGAPTIVSAIAGGDAVDCSS